MNLVGKMEQEVLEQVMIKREIKKEEKVAPVPHQKMENHSKEEGLLIQTLLNYSPSCPQLN